MKGIVLYAAAIAFIAVAPSAAQRAKHAMKASPAGDPAAWFGSEDYPQDALRAGRAGRVILELGLDSTGSVASCDVRQFSGTISLDQRSCELALQKGRFNPATDRKGNPIASTFLLPVRWAFDESGAISSTTATDISKSVAFEAIAEWTVGTDGIVESCRLITRAGESAPDPCKQAPVGTPWGTRYIDKGEPVRVIVRASLSQSVRAVSLP